MLMMALSKKKKKIYIHLFPNHHLHFVNANNRLMDSTDTLSEMSIIKIIFTITQIYIYKH